MRILHIAGGFAQQPLYTSLVGALRALGHRQAVFVPVRSEQELLRQPADVPGELSFRFEHILKPYHRAFFRRKVSVILARLRTCFEMRDFDIIHAHTLYSDGAVALELSRCSGLPFVTAVRNTDVNYFMRLRPDLRRTMEDVVMHAARIVFLSPAYRTAFLRRFDGGLRDKLECDSAVISNGLGECWLEDAPATMPSSEVPLKLLFVGSFTRSKNVLRILHAAAAVARRRPVELTLVGSGGSRERQIQRALASGRFPFARWLGRLTDSTALRDAYRANDIFVMPSIRETFGIVYLEALSQGLPVIYSKGQGVDGYFEPRTVGEAVDPRNVTQIAEKIEVLAQRLDAVRPQCRAEARRFAWNRVAEQYDELYYSVASMRQ